MSKKFFNFLKLSLLLPFMLILSACFENPPDDPPPTNPTTLQAPVLTLIGNTASWNNVEYASKYGLSINNGNMFEITLTSYTLTNGQTLKVKAIGDGVNYLSSSWSNEVTYNAPPPAEQLATPTVSLTAETKTFTWSEVQNASSYDIKLLKDTEEVYSLNTTENSFALTNNLDIGSYTFEVIAKSTSSSYTNSNKGTTTFNVLQQQSPVITTEENIFTITTVSDGELIATFNNSTISLTKVNHTTYTYEAIESGTLAVYLKGENMLLLDSLIVSKDIEFVAKTTYQDVITELTSILSTTVQNSISGSISNFQIKYINYSNAMAFVSYKHSNVEYVETFTIEGLQNSKSYNEIISNLQSYTISSVEKFNMVENQTTLAFARKLISNDTTYSKYYNPTDVVWAMYTPDYTTTITMFLCYNDGYLVKKTFTITNSSSNNDNYFQNYIDGYGVVSNARDIMGYKYVDLQTAFEVDNSIKAKALSKLTKKLEDAILAKYQGNQLQNPFNVRINYINKANGIVSCIYNSYLTRGSTTTYSIKFADVLVPELINSTSYQNIYDNVNSYTCTVQTTTSINGRQTDNYMTSAKGNVGSNAILYELQFVSENDIDFALRNSTSTSLIALKNGLILEYNSSYDYTDVNKSWIYLSLEDAFDNTVSIAEINIELVKKINEKAHQLYNLSYADSQNIPRIISYNISEQRCYFMFNDHIFFASISGISSKKSLDEIYTLIKNSNNITVHDVANVFYYETIKNSMKNYAQATKTIWVETLTNLGKLGAQVDFDDIKFFIVPCFELYSTRVYKTRLCYYTKDGKLIYVTCLVRDITVDETDDYSYKQDRLLYVLGKPDNSESGSQCQDWSISSYNHFVTLEDYIKKGFQL